MVFPNRRGPASLRAAYRATEALSRFTGAVLGAMLFEDGIARPLPAAAPAPRAAAKSVFWLFMLGGASHIETFDPKPALRRYAGKTIGETPHRGALQAPQLTKNFRMFAGSGRIILDGREPDRPVDRP